MAALLHENNFTMIGFKIVVPLRDACTKTHNLTVSREVATLHPVLSFITFIVIEHNNGMHFHLIFLYIVLYSVGEFCAFQKLKVIGIFNIYIGKKSSFSFKNCSTEVLIV